MAYDALPHQRRAHPDESSRATPMTLPLPVRMPFVVAGRTAEAVGWVARQAIGERAHLIADAADGIERLADGSEELLEEGVERVGDVVTGSLEIAEDVVEEGQDLIEDALGLHRRIWQDDHGHAQIEVRGLAEPRGEAFRRRVKAAVERLDGVEWAEVNAITERLAVAFDSSSSPLSAIVAAVETVERAHGVARGRRRPADWDVDDRADHPSDAEPAHRAIAMLAGNSLALSAAVAGRVVRAPRIPAELAAAASMLEHLPWVRRGARRVVGKRVVDEWWASGWST